MRGRWFVLLFFLVACPRASAQATREPDWRSVEAEIIEHFQALLRLDTSNPPGNEKLATDYLQQVLQNGLYRFIQVRWDIVNDLARTK